MVCTRMTDEVDLYDMRLRQVMADMSLLVKFDDEDPFYGLPQLTSSPESSTDFHWNSTCDEYEPKQYLYDASCSTISDSCMKEEILMDLSLL